MPDLPSRPRRRLYHWTRDLHLYAGLFLSPFLLVFAISTVVLNHQTTPERTGSPGPSWEKPVTVNPAAPVPLDEARSVLRQLGLTGEIENVIHNKKEHRLTIPVAKPGELTTVSVNLDTNIATVQRRVDGMAAALVYLHMRPGQHLAMFRGNWLYMAAWARLADATVYGTIFLTVSGLYLWWFFKAERRIGWALLVAGFLTVGGLAGVLAIA